jgi:hypothetical protein
MNEGVVGISDWIVDILGFKKVVTRVGPYHEIRAKVRVN